MAVEADVGESVISIERGADGIEEAAEGSGGGAVVDMLWRTQNGQF